MRPHPDAADSSSLILHPCRAVYHRSGIDSVAAAAALPLWRCLFASGRRFCPEAASHVDKCALGKHEKVLSSEDAGSANTELGKSAIMSRTWRTFLKPTLDIECRSMKTPAGISRN